METAKDMVRVERLETHPNGQKLAVLRIPANDYDAYTNTPNALKNGTELYGKTGWNSDTGEVYYKTGVLMFTVQQ